MLDKSADRMRQNLLGDCGNLNGFMNEKGFALVVRENDIGNDVRLPCRPNNSPGENDTNNGENKREILPERCHGERTAIKVVPCFFAFDPQTLYVALFLGHLYPLAWKFLRQNIELPFREDYTIRKSCERVDFKNEKEEESESGLSNHRG